MSDNKISDIFYYESDCVSLYDVKEILKIKKLEKDEFKRKQERNIDCLVKEKYGKNAFCFISDFDYSEDKLRVCFKYTWDFKFIHFEFSKKDGKLYADKTISNNRFKSDEILCLLQSELSKVYDEYSKFKLYNTQFKSNIQSVNTNFYVDIDKNNIEIYFKGNEVAFPKDNKFYVRFDKENKDNNAKFSSKKILPIEDESEEDVFKKIFVKIEDCPFWMHEELLCLKQEKIDAENNSIVNEDLSTKQNKIRNKIKKLFPLSKK